MASKIPKVIHYCWFGRNPLPETAKKCIQSWRKFLPDYEIKEWNEDNFDINSCYYASEAYLQRSMHLLAIMRDSGYYIVTVDYILIPMSNSFDQ